MTPRNRDCLSPPPEGTRDRAAYDRFRAFLEQAGPPPIPCHAPSPAATPSTFRYRCTLQEDHRPGHVAHGPRGQVYAVWFDA